MLITPFSSMIHDIFLVLWKTFNRKQVTKQTSENTLVIWAISGQLRKVLNSLIKFAFNSTGNPQLVLPGFAGNPPIQSIILRGGGEKACPTSINQSTQFYLQERIFSCWFTKGIFLQAWLSPGNIWYLKYYMYFRSYFVKSKSLD